MSTTETTAIETTIDRYFATWNEADRTARLQQVSAVWIDTGHYVDPLSDATGHEEIVDMIEGVRAQFAGATLARTTDIDAHHHVAKFGWSATGTDGETIVAGTDVCVLAEDGRLAAIAGFFS